ncbi:MAG: hypothetical protein V3S03_08390 [Vicinamibacteria bacterium]
MSRVFQVPRNWRDPLGLLAYVFGWGADELLDLETRELEAWVAQARKWSDRLPRRG